VRKIYCYSYFFKHLFRGNVGQIFSRYFWEFPQTILGGWYALFVIAFWHIEEMQCYNGVLVIKCHIGSSVWGGICFGSIILGDSRIDAEINNRLFMHEFGHTLQSRAVGPIYLFKYGIPSLMSAYSDGVHQQHPVEKDANLRAHKWFAKQKGFEEWDLSFNPLPENDRTMPIKWWEFLPPHFPFMHLYKAVKMSRALPRK
jgi:hypothetical protein